MIGKISQMVVFMFTMVESKQSPTKQIKVDESKLQKTTKQNLYHHTFQP